MESRAIPQKLPGLIEAGLQAGGVAWPVLTGLEQTLQEKGLKEPVQQNSQNKNIIGII